MQDQPSEPAITERLTVIGEALQEEISLLKAEGASPERLRGLAEVAERLFALSPTKAHTSPSVTQLVAELNKRPAPTGDQE